MGNIIKFPSNEPEVMRFQVTINDSDEFSAFSISRPLFQNDEWHVLHKGETKFAAGPSFWQPIIIGADEELFEALQEADCPMRLKLEVVVESEDDEDDLIDGEWWELEGAYLSADSDANVCFIHYMHAYRHEEYAIDDEESAEP